MLYRHVAACPAILCTLLACVSLALAADSPGPAAKTRLPAAFTEPVSYDVTFTPAFNGTRSTFTGHVRIVIRVLDVTNVVTLNLKDLTVSNVTVTDVRSGRPVAVKGVEYRATDEQVDIRCNRSLITSRFYTVSIGYGGDIRNDMSGLYMSSYQEGNQTRWLAVTQFEPVYARRAFPCYDEPAYKAVFNISVVKKKDQIALSNMPISSTEPFGSNDTELVRFQTTPLMSTYLAAIFVGDFVANKKDSNVKVYTHAALVNQTEYVVSEAQKHLDVLSNYTGIEYMLPKMDLLAIPDFKAGAMENWGMNTYRESYLLLHEETKSRMKIRASEVVQHEFTHQWFGDLVTCAWWDYLWLNEGFARYFQYFATAMVRTSWPVDEQFVIEAHQGALAYDQTPRHPITSSVNTPSEIENIFDTISYSKAASVLRMLNHIVTEKLFQSSLRNYLNDNRENVAEPKHLYSAFDSELEDSGVTNNGSFTVNEFMLSWTLQSGYPVLEITKNSTSNTFSVIQKRFLISENSTAEKTKWIIGLTFTTEKNKNFSDTKPSVWTDKTSNLTKVPAPSNSGWYIFNIQSTGFYRVNYDIDNWMALIKQLNNASADIHVLNRAQLISDSFNLAKAGQLNYTVALELTKYLKNENSTTPWYSAMQGFSYLLQRMPRSEKGYANLKAYVSNLAGTIYKKLENRVVSGNSELFVKSAWEDFSRWACKLENKYCTKKALEYFNQWKAGKKIPADIKDAAFCAGVKNSNSTNDDTFYKMFNLYTTTTSISEKMSAESALGCSTNRTQLKEYINHILDGPQGPIKEKYYSSVISSISVTPLGLDVLHEFLSNNLNKTITDLTDGPEIAKHIYSTLASKFTNDVDIEKIRNLKNDSSIPDSVRKSFEESFEKINDHTLWFDKYSQVIGDWAQENQEPEEQEVPPTTTTQPITTVKGPTTAHPVTGADSSSTTTPKPSSATSNVQNSLMILQFTAIVMLVKRYIF